MPQCPYQRSYEFVPFRAPHHRETIAHSCARFFIHICAILHELDQNAEWLAAWAPHLCGHFYGHHAASWLLGAVLRGGGEEADALRSVLVDSIKGEHEIGQMGHHCIMALLNSDERSDWELIGKLLVVAEP